MLALEEALSRILAAIPAPVPERVTLKEAHGRFALERVLSPMDLPLFNNSSMDGYALRAADTANARPDSPACLRLIGRVAAGEIFNHPVHAGNAVRLFTGSPVPEGADAVVMQEETRFDSDRPDALAVLAAVEPGENVRRRGEDLPKGAPLLEAGQELTVGRISVLAAVGIEQVVAGRRPRVGVLATGSELREPGQAIAPGQIYESNRLGLAALIQRAGGQPQVFPIVRDALDETRAALLKAFDQSDLLVTSGGVSVGEMDFIKSALEQNGGGLDFWKVSVKPGRPFVFGRWQQKLLFGVPGNPVSALVTFLMLVRPAVLKWQGATELSLPSSPGTLAEDLVNDGARRHFFRVKVDADGQVRSTGLQASHALGSLAAANGLVDVPPNGTLKQGALVRVLRWE